LQKRKRGIGPKNARNDERNTSWSDRTADCPRMISELCNWTGSGRPPRITFEWALIYSLMAL
jgi:hypothetical protein